MLRAWRYRPGWFAVAASLLVAPLLALCVVVLSGRGSPLPIALDVLLGGLACLAALAICLRRHVVAGVTCLLELSALLALVASYRASPLQVPRRYSGNLPAASPPSEMRAYRLSTGSNHRTAAFGYRGGSFSEPREFAMTAVLLRHPRGDLLIDTGFGARVAEQLASMPLGFRLSTAYTFTRSAAQQLTAAGYDTSRLRGVLLTHAHWDHVSGVADLGAVPVLVPRAEAQFVAHSGWIGDVARSSGARFETYAFDGAPYLGFPSSHDLHGDGAIVVVPAPGHTPGSVVVFVTLPDARRYAFVGDLAWQLEGITEREERPWLVRAMGDDDPAAVRENLLRMAALHARFPELTLVPAHDPRGFASFADVPEDRFPPATK